MQLSKQLSIKNISKSYAKVKAVNNLSFDINQGEIFALLGPNGAGKSSLVRMLIGFTHPDEGQITITLDGNTYASIPHHVLGYLPEDRGLYGEKTLQQNLMYFAQLRGVDKKTAQSRIDDWLEKFDLTERKNERLKALSKGNQQKVQLISAVLHAPKIVLLDEPFSGLDPINQEKVVEFLTQLRQQGMTVILSAHQMAMVEKLADRMLLMDQGQAVLYGSLTAIKQQVGVGLEITLSFTQAINSCELSLEHLNANVTQLHKNTLQIELKDTQHLNPLLIEVAKLAPISTIKTKEMNLHQLYLKAIAQHQAKSPSTNSSKEPAHVA